MNKIFEKKKSIFKNKNHCYRNNGALTPCARCIGTFTYFPRNDSLTEEQNLDVRFLLINLSRFVLHLSQPPRRHLLFHFICHFSRGIIQWVVISSSCTRERRAADEITTRSSINAIRVPVRAYRECAGENLTFYRDAAHDQLSARRRCNAIGDSCDSRRA